MDVAICDIHYIFEEGGFDTASPTQPPWDNLFNQ